MDAEPIYFNHYNKIVADSILENGQIETLSFNSFKKLKLGKGQLKEIKIYKNHKLTFYKEFISSKTYYIYYYFYDKMGSLIEEYKYDSNNLMEYHTKYFYENRLISKSINECKYLVYTVNYFFDSKGRIKSEILYKNQYRYSENLYMYSEDSLFEKKYSVSTDTTSKFLKYDTLSILSIDKFRNISYEEFPNKYSPSDITVTKLDFKNRPIEQFSINNSNNLEYRLSSSDFVYSPNEDIFSKEEFNGYKKNEKIFLILVHKKSNTLYMYPKFDELPKKW